MERDMNATEMRHAFERDVVRRHGRLTFKPLRAIMGECVVCDTEYKKRCYNSITCSKACASEQHRRRNRR